MKYFYLTLIVDGVQKKVIKDDEIFLYLDRIRSNTHGFVEKVSAAPCAIVVVT